FYGNVAATYQFNDNWKASAIARGNFYGRDVNSRVASNTLDQDSYAQRIENQQELNFVGNVDYNTKVDDFEIGAAVYIENRRNQVRFNDGQTEGGLAVPDLYTLAASKDRPTIESYFSDYKVNSLYGYLTL